MPVLNVTECAQKVADLAPSGAARSALVRSLAPSCRLVGESAFAGMANAAPEPQPTIRFSPESAALAQVTAVVRDALAAEEAMWSAGERASIRTEILLLAGRVEELDTGLYLAGGQGFTPAALGSQRQVSWIRNGYGDAPVLLLVCGDLGAALSGDYLGYQALLNRAGLLGHAAWLSAATRGLTGSISGRPHSQVTALARQLGGLHHLVTVALGKSADGSASVAQWSQGRPSDD